MGKVQLACLLDCERATDGRTYGRTDAVDKTYFPFSSYLFVFLITRTNESKAGALRSAEHAMLPQRPMAGGRGAGYVINT